MRLAEPASTSWKAGLYLGFEFRNEKTILSEKRSDGPLVVQKPLYPEGDETCHAIVVHPPGGIAGGDELELRVKAGGRACALLTTPGAAKWYRSAGPWARQRLAFEISGNLEWLPRETIVFDGALASLESEIVLRKDAAYIGWEVVCLRRSGSGERFRRGQVRMETKIFRDARLLWLERGKIEGGGTLMRSPAGLAQHSVFGTLVAAASEVPKGLLAACREGAKDLAVTLLPGLLLARYLGDSSEQAMQCFARLWEAARPSIMGKTAIAPRIWST